LNPPFSTLTKRMLDTLPLNLQIATL
jgi:hypothetical protein